MKNKHTSPPYRRLIIFCTIFTIIWYTTPIQASVSDNLNSIVVKILGQKNETTTKSNYQNASLAAKLNYLETEMANLKTKVEISGGTPRLVECGFVGPYETKTFTGPGYLLVEETGALIILDGINLNDGFLWANSDLLNRLDFRESMTIHGNNCGQHTKYLYYKY